LQPAFFSLIATIIAFLLVQRCSWNTDEFLDNFSNRPSVILSDHE